MASSSWSADLTVAREGESGAREEERAREEAGREGKRHTES